MPVNQHADQEHVRIESRVEKLKKRFYLQVFCRPKAGLIPPHEMPCALTHVQHLQSRLGIVERARRNCHGARKVIFHRTMGANDLCHGARAKSLPANDLNPVHRRHMINRFGCGQGAVARG